MFVIRTQIEDIQNFESEIVILEPLQYVLGTHAELVGWFMVFKATFNNFTVILWLSVLLLEESGVPEKTTNLLQVTNKLYYRILRTIGRYFFSSTRWLRPIVHIDLYKDEVKKIWNP